MRKFNFSSLPVSSLRVFGILKWFSAKWISLKIWRNFLPRVSWTGRRPTERTSPSKRASWVGRVSPPLLGLVTTRLPSASALAPRIVFLRPRTRTRPVKTEASFYMPKRESKKSLTTRPEKFSLLLYAFFGVSHFLKTESLFRRCHFYFRTDDFSFQLMKVREKKRFAILRSRLKKRRIYVPKASLGFIGRIRRAEKILMVFYSSCLKKIEYVTRGGENSALP